MKIAVIGALGRMGQMHAGHLGDLGHEVAAFDTATPWTGDPHGGIEDVIVGTDAVVIASPADCHLRHLQLAVAMGKHVFVEKPICLIGETDSALGILSTAKDRGLIVGVGYNLRFHPHVCVVKNMIEDGRLNPLFASFVLRQKPARPVTHFLEEWASHEVDLALHLLGDARMGVGDTRHLFYDGATIRLDVEHDTGDLPHSFIHVDKETEPFVRSFTIVDQNGNSYWSDIEKNHVQDEHYKDELFAWTTQIGFGGPNPADRSHARLATGWEGLAAIRLLEEVTS